MLSVNHIIQKYESNNLLSEHNNNLLKLLKLNSYILINIYYLNTSTVLLIFNTYM